MILLEFSINYIFDMNIVILKVLFCALSSDVTMPLGLILLFPTVNEKCPLIVIVIMSTVQDCLRFGLPQKLECKVFWS